MARAWWFPDYTGVDRSRQRRLYTKRDANVSVQIVRFVDSDFPGWVECELTDADGRRHIIRDKVPVFTAELLDDQSRYPVTGDMPCEIVQRFHDTQGRELVRVSTEQCGIEFVEGVTDFTVAASL